MVTPPGSPESATRIVAVTESAGVELASIVATVVHAALPETAVQVPVHVLMT